MPLPLNLALALTIPATPAAATRLPHEYDLQQVTYDLTIDYKTESIQGTVTNQVALSKANATIHFDKGPMRITKVTLPKGVKHKVKISPNQLSIETKGTKAGQKVAVTIAYSAQPEAGIFFVPQSRAYPAMTDITWTQGEMEDTRYWLPTYDFPDDKAKVTGTIRVPKGFSVLSNGKLIGKKDTATQSVWTWKMDQQMSTYLISVVTGRFAAIPDGNFKGKPVELWAPKGVEEWAKSSFSGTDKIVALYSKLTGVDYPWPKYAQSFVPEFTFGGMENTSCTTQTINALTPPGTLKGEANDGLNAHELAHQWFGDLITTKNWDNIWINEGWATFMPHFWTRQSMGEDAFHMDRFGTYQGAYFSALQNPMVRNDYKEPLEMFDGNAYPGGATRMFMLMKQLGEERFWKATQAYLKQYGYKNLDTHQFFDTWSKLTGEDLVPFKQMWFYTKGAPKVTLSRKDGNFEVIQKTAGFKIALEYKVFNNQGMVSSGQVNLEPNTPAQIATKADEFVLLDPGAWMLGDIDYANGLSDEQYEMLWKKAENAAAKARMMSKIGAKKDLVGRLYQWEPNISVKLMLVGSLRDEFKLIQLSQDSEPRIQQAAVAAMFNLRSDAVKSRLREIFDSTADQSIKESAYEALLRAEDNEATAELGWKTKTFTLATQRAALNWYAGKNPSKAREMALEAVRNFAPGPVRMAAIQVLGRVKDEPGKREVYNLLIDLAKGRAFSPMSAAVSALATYGDKAAIPVIESRRNHSLIFARQAVEGALAQLKR